MPRHVRPLRVPHCLPLRPAASAVARAARRPLAQNAGADNSVAGALADAPAGAVRGLIVAGEISRASNIGETARLMAAAGPALGVPTCTTDVPPFSAVVRRAR